MNKFTDYINKHSVEEVVKSILDNKRDVELAIQNTRDCRTEFQIKSQELEWALKEIARYEVGVKLIAMEDFLNAIKKGEFVTITHMRGVMITLDGDRAQASESIVRSKFRIVKG